MDFCKALDYGNAPVVPVDRVVRIERVSANKVRVTYCVRLRSADGVSENVVNLHTDWDIEVFLGSRQLYHAAEEQLVREIGTAVNDNNAVSAPLH